jgi:hypothetical protein
MKKKFRTKIDRLARALMALVVVIALSSGISGCFGTTGTSPSNGKGAAVAAVIAAAPIQPFVPLSAEEVALASSNGLLISPVGGSGPVTVLDSQTTKDYVDAVRLGLQYVRVWQKINAELPQVSRKGFRIGHSNKSQTVCDSNGRGGALPNHAM